MFFFRGSSASNSSSSYSLSSERKSEEGRDNTSPISLPLDEEEEIDFLPFLCNMEEIENAQILTSGEYFQTYLISSLLKLLFFKLV